MKKHLLKSLLVGVMTLAATGAWADEITATLVHTSSSGVPSATAGAYVSTIDAEQEYINNSAFGNKNWQGAAYADFSFEIPADQTITKATLTWSGIGSGKNRTTDLMYVNAGLSLDYSEEGLGSGTAQVNLAATKIEAVTFPANTTTQFTSDVTDAVKTIAASQAYIIFKFTNNVGAGNLVGKGAASGAPALVITTQDASSTTSYTVKFVDEGGNELKAAAEHTGVTKGTTVSATTEETASFYSEDNSKKYIYASGNSETVVADDGTTVITLVFREAAVYNYSVKTSLGATISEGTAFEGDEITYYFPQYQMMDGTLYETTKNSNMLRNTATVDTNNKEIVVNYTATETTGVVFLTEAEDIDGAKSSMTGNADIRCSMGTGAYFESNATVTTLDPGKYKMTAQVWGNATTTFGIKVGDATVLSIDTKGYINQETSDEFEVTVASEVTIPAVGNANRVLDLLYIVKTGDVDLALVAAEEALEDAISQATTLNAVLSDASLTAAIAAATTALNDTEATAASLAAAAQTLGTATTDALRSTLQKAINMANTFGVATDATAAAEDVLANEDATVNQLQDALLALYAVAKPAAQKALAEVKSFFKTFDGAAATALADDFTAVENALQGTNVDAMNESARTLATDALPYAKADLEKVIEYTEVIDDATVNADIEAAKTAIEGSNLIAMVAAAKQIETDFLAAAPDFVDEVDATATQAEADGKNGVEELKAAVAAAKAAIDAENATAVTVGLAIHNLIDALKAFEEANNPTQLLADGVYYLYNEYAGKFASRGSSWGTRAVADDYGLPFNITADLPNDTYKLQMLDNDVYYGDDYWMYADCSGDRVRSYTLEATEGGYYLHNTARDVADNRMYVYMKDDADKWAIAGNAILDDNISDEAQAVWQFLTQAERDEIVAAREAAEKAAAFESASIEADADLTEGEATELTFATGSAWTFTAVRSGSSAATNDNGTEVYQGTGTFTQAVENLESGLYKVSIQAFYRDGSNAAVAANYDLGYNLSTAYLNANGTNIQVKSWGADRSSDTEPNGMNTAAALFAEGKYLSEGYAFVGEDGKLDLTVYVPSYIDYGWFIAGNVKYAKVSTGEEIVSGDANLDGEVTVTDAVLAVSFALEKEEPTAQQFQAADVNKSNDITIADAVAIVNIALEKDEAPAGARSTVLDNSRLVIDGQTVSLVNTMQFVAFQMDVTLADDALFNGVQLGERAAALEVSYNRVGQNTYRIAAISFQGAAIEGNAGELLKLDIAGNSNVSISNIEFADTYAQAYKLAGQTTGINSLTTAAANAGIFSVSGARSNSLRKGLNVVRGNDGQAKKFIVK